MATSPTGALASPIARCSPTASCARCGIDAECYDAELLSSFDLYISDKPAPRYFHPVAPQVALGKHRRICLLTHPSQWHAGWAANSHKNLVRALDAWLW